MPAIRKEHPEFFQHSLVWLQLLTSHTHADSRHKAPLATSFVAGKIASSGWGTDSASSPRKKAKQRTNFETLGN
jgi:hypothetical protein